MKSRRARAALFSAALVALLALAAPASAWGARGHELVCRVAYAELTARARRGVDELLRGDRFLARLRDPAARFARVCTWPDAARESDGRRADHYVNVPRSWRSIRRASCGQAARCIFSAFEMDADALAHARDPRARRDALAYLAHWVGDLHQPLHVSYADDRGGNEIVLREGPCVPRSGPRAERKTDLHHVWDVCLVEQLAGSDARAAQRLRADGAASRAAWLASAPADWANESYQLARAPGTGYCVVHARPGAPGERRESCDPAPVPRVDAAYLAAEVPVARQRLAQAGIRLGALLNRVLDPPR